MSRASSVLFVGSSILFASAFSFVTPRPAQQEAPKKAEEQFKNIKSFKGESADEIIPAMQLMSVSLGVKCTFCHVEGNWASDDNKVKDRARQMIDMTHAINDTNFNGGKQITCYTCHGGHSRPSNAPVIFGTSARFRRDAAVTADSVLVKYREAIGGDAAITELKSVHLTGTSTQGDGPAAPAELFEASPNKFLLVRGGQKTAFNGADTWMGTPQGSRKMDPAHTQMIQRTGRFFRDAASLPPFERPSAGTAVVDGKTYNVVGGNVPAFHEREVLYFDPETGLLDRAAYFTTTILGDLPEVYLFSDYRKVGGVMIPFKVTQQGASGSSVTQFTTSEANAKLSDDLFNVPK